MWPGLKGAVGSYVRYNSPGLPLPEPVLRPLSKGSPAPRPRGGSRHSALRSTSRPGGGVGWRGADFRAEGALFPPVLHPTGATGLHQPHCSEAGRLLPYVTGVTNLSQAPGRHCKALHRERQAANILG